MTVTELLSAFGNWLLASLAAIVGYVVWREKTVSKVAALSRDLERADTDIQQLRAELKDRSKSDGAITAALASIQAELRALSRDVAELRAEMKLKADREHK